ncbi:MAG: ATP-dependent helicase, partial [Chloroflexota bacterium]|nr:ATP-dependent helicase [Chloroflexota bacterium]
VLNPTQWRWALSWMDAAKEELIPPEHSEQWFADRIQQNLQSVPDLARAVASTEAPLLTDLYTKYQAHMQAEGLCDFTDMLCYTLQAFRANSETLTQEQQRFSYVLVDELQDTSAIQYQVLSMIAKHTHLFVVGDEVQALYAFRRADPDHNVLSFLQKHPQGEVIKLECNYRSTRTIVNVANRLLAAVPYEDDRYRKVLQPRPDAQEGLQVEVSYHKDDQEEADSVADKIEALIGAEGYLPQDIFVLYRTNAQSAPIERALSARDIPHVLMAGLGFWERSATKDIMAYLRLYNKQNDNAAFERICNYASVHIPTSGTRYLGRKFVETCKQLNPDSYWDSMVGMAQNPPERSWRQGIQDFIRMMAEAPKQGSAGWSLPELVLYFTKQYDHHRQMEDTTDATGWLTGSAIASLSRRFPGLPHLIAYSVREGKKTKSDAQAHKSVVLGTIHSA